MNRPDLLTRRRHLLFVRAILLNDAGGGRYAQLAVDLRDIMTSREKHDRMANAIRFLSMDAVEKAKSGHPGMPMGMADVATVLFTKYMKYDPKWPEWPDRDRFILSAGHGSMLIYSLLYLTGYENPTIDDIKNFLLIEKITPNDKTESLNQSNSINILLASEAVAKLS